MAAIQECNPAPNWLTGAISAPRARAGQRCEVLLQDRLPEPVHAGRTSAPPQNPPLHSRRKGTSSSTPDHQSFGRLPQRSYLLRLTLSLNTRKVNDPKVVLPCTSVTSYRESSNAGRTNKPAANDPPPGRSFPVITLAPRSLIGNCGMIPRETHPLAFETRGPA